MTDIDALIKKLFPVTANGILRDLAALDFSFVIPPKARARAWKGSYIFDSLRNLRYYLEPRLR